MVHSISHITHIVLTQICRSIYISIYSNGVAGDQSIDKWNMPELFANANILDIDNKCSDFLIDRYIYIYFDVWFYSSFQFKLAIWRTAPGDAVLDRSIENLCGKNSESPWIHWIYGIIIIFKDGLLFVVCLSEFRYLLYSSTIQSMFTFVFSSQLTSSVIVVAILTWSRWCSRAVYLLSLSREEVASFCRKSIEGATKEVFNATSQGGAVIAVDPSMAWSSADFFKDSFDPEDHHGERSCSRRIPGQARKGISVFAARQTTACVVALTARAFRGCDFPKCMGQIIPLWSFP